MPQLFPNSNGYVCNCLIRWLRGVDLNHRTLGYEPNELPDCSTPRIHSNRAIFWGQKCAAPHSSQKRSLKYLSPESGKIVTMTGF